MQADAVLAEEDPGLPTGAGVQRITPVPTDSGLLGAKHSVLVSPFSVPASLDRGAGVSYQNQMKKLRLRAANSHS